MDQTRQTRDDQDGFKSEGLQKALVQAWGGKTDLLELLLARSGALPSPRPNVKLAAAFGVEVASWKGNAVPLLLRLSDDDASTDEPRAFLPIAAAFGWAACVRADKNRDAAWTALADLVADGRAPVRLGAIEAVLGICQRPGEVKHLMAQAQTWWDIEDRDHRFGSAAAVVEILGDAGRLASLDPSQALPYLARALSEIADAPRAAERLDGRRRLLMALPRTLALAVSVFNAGDEGRNWLQTICTEAVHPDVRQVLSQTIVKLRSPTHGISESVADALRDTLAKSAKPLRDPSRVRPGTGRGRDTRRVR